MFIYFIQKKAFLDGDINYLRNKLAKSRQRGKDRFYTDFLSPLFFEGFAKKESARSSTTRELLGKVPYLNGGIFQRHQIEALYGKSIRIADAAFEKLFDFFEQYRWHLDERPLRADNEINPDVLGYIFEKYINQKQMGAYYTKEDITGYISQNTVIPFLFDSARRACKIAFEGAQPVWRLLQIEPDRYIYEPVRLGVIDEKGEVIPETILPDFVQRGMSDPTARMFDKRYNLGEADLRDSAGRKLTLPAVPDVAAACEEAEAAAERRSAGAAMPPEPPELTDAVATLREHLKARLGQLKHDAWFADVRLKSVERERVVLVAPSKFLRDRIVQEFGPDLEACAKAIAPECWRVDVVLRDGVAP
jgi:hypothetical protein